MMTVTTYFVIFSAIVFEVLGQVCLKRGAISPGDEKSDRRARFFWTAVARSGWTYAGLGAYAIELFLWIAALHSAPLSQALPLMSLTYCGVALASRLFLKERISARGVAAMALITLGVVLLVGATL